ncbi:MAG: hypothetical protein V3V67_03325 [Myxococcota bacterium]
MRDLRLPALYLLFFASGVSGLVYQVIWVRQLGLVFGNTVGSAALTTAVFMSGLGLGSYLAGRWIDRVHQRASALPLRAYGVFELGIAGLGVGLALGLPALQELAPALARYTLADTGWHVLSAGSHALQYALATVLLLPSTLLMGGTLTLLIRLLLVSDLAQAGWRTGSLYGFNTAGAALGALLTDFALVPEIGLFRAQLLAAALNAAAGIAALGLAAIWLAGAPEGAGEPTRAETSAGDKRLVGLTALAIALSGFAAMGMEILWFRHLISLLGGYRSTFSALLAVILVGIWLGAFAAGRAERRTGRPARLYMMSQVGFALSALVLLALYDGRDLRAADNAWVATLVPILALVGLPALFMGAAFPLANAHVQRSVTHIGRRAGLVYLANTAGGVLGAVATGFWLLPIAGVQQAALLLALCALAAVAPLYLSVRGQLGAVPSRPRVLGAACAAVAVLGVFAALPGDYLSLRVIDRDVLDTSRVVAIGEGRVETVAVLEGRNGDRALYTNGHNMSGTGLVAQRYMRAFAHVPLLLADAPKDVLVICFGVGNTANAASLHPSVERLEIADLSRNVLEHAPHFRRWNRDVLLDPRVSVFVNDGRHHLRAQPEARYDLVTMEPPPIAYAGVASLYSREFYELVRSRLKPGGFTTQWLPIAQVPPQTARSLVRAFVDVFPEGILLGGAGSMLILMGRRDEPLQVDPDALARRMRARPAAARDLGRVVLGSPTEILGSFAASGSSLRAAVADAKPVTDDLPLLEYGVHAGRHRVELASDLFDTSGFGDFCPACVSGGGPTGLDAYLRVMAAIYASESFLSGRGVSEDAPRLPSELLDEPGVLAVLRDSPYLRMLSAPSEQDYARAVRAFVSGDPRRAAELFERVLSESPVHAFAYRDVGWARLAVGDLEAAADAFAAAVRLDSEDARARAGLDDALDRLAARGS